MDKVTFIQITDPTSQEVIDYAIIDRGNGEFTSMLKSTYEELAANEATTK